MKTKETIFRDSILGTDNEVLKILYWEEGNTDFKKLSFTKRKTTMNLPFAKCSQAITPQSSRREQLKTWNMFVQSLSCVGLFATPWAVARQAPLSMGFPRQEYWSR